MKKKHRFPFKTLISLLILGGGGYGAYLYFGKSISEKITYQTSPAEKGEIIQTITASGQLNPVVTVQVGSQISGIIKKMHADFNSTVKKGQIIAELDPSTFEANVIQAKGELANAKAARQLATLQKERTEALFSKDAAPKSSLDKATADLEQAEAAVQIREASLKRSEVDLARCTIYSPIDGVVISRSVDVGQTVAASLSAPTLFIIANDLAKMQIDTNVSEADIGTVQVEQNATFTVDAFPGQTFKGIVSQIRNSPIVSQNVVSYDTIIEVDNSELKLKPGMTANVSIITAHKKDILMIKNAALRVRIENTETKADGEKTKDEVASKSKGNGDRPFGSRKRGKRDRSSSEISNSQKIFILSSDETDPHPKPVMVKTGISDGIHTEILDGINDGAPVIISVMGIQKAKNGPPDSPFGGGSRRPF